VDFNDDGILDFILGERDGQYFFYTGNGDGTLHFIGHPYDDEGGLIERNYNSSGYLADWNADGLLDFIAGGYMTETSSGGLFQVHLNVGSASSPVWDADVIDLTSFYNRWRTTHQYVDMDGDMDGDLVLGYEMGEVFYAENTGSASSPVFTTYSTMQSDGGPINVYTNFNGGGRARENAIDYNDDGIIDLLVGCNSGWIYFFEGYYTGTGGSATQPLDPFGITLAGVPTTGTFSVLVTSPGTAPVEITVFDASGRIASQTTCQGGSSTVSMDLSGHPAGMYIVAAVLEDQVHSVRLVKIE
jgi:hypothetical protein